MPDSLDHQWRKEKVHDFWRIVNLKSDSCIAVPEASKSPGRGIIDWPISEKRLNSNGKSNPRVEGITESSTEIVGNVWLLAKRRNRPVLGHVSGLLLEQKHWNSSGG